MKKKRKLGMTMEKYLENGRPLLKKNGALNKRRKKRIRERIITPHKHGGFLPFPISFLGAIEAVGGGGPSKVRQ